MGFIWSYLVHLGMNNWKDIPLDPLDLLESTVRGS